MANDPVRAGYWARFDLLSFLGGAGQWVVSNWAAVSGFLFGGTLMGYLAYLQALPPLYWGAAFFAGLIGVAAFLALRGWGRSRDALADLYKASAATPSSFNRLQNEFARQTLKVNDLIHPLGEPLREKTFIDCEFHGPGLLGLSGCHFSGGSGGGNVELVRLKSNTIRILPTRATLINCQLVRCRFYNVAIAVTSETADDMKKGSPDLSVLGE